MNSFQGRNKHTMDWEQIEKLIGRKLPAFKPDQANQLLPDTSWVEGYVQDVIKKSMPSVKNASSSSFPSDVFETHNSVIVKVTIPADRNPNEIQVFIKSNQVKLEGLSKGNKTYIKLPALVNPKSGVVRLKQGVLQISMRKRTKKEPYHETFIQF
jgi:HSP20 family molecular chaperone IbpA